MSTDVKSFDFVRGCISIQNQFHPAIQTVKHSDRRKSPKKLGANMREVRLRLEMTQEQVADYLGTDSGAVSRYERGLREPSLLEILAFSRMSGVGLDVLIDNKMSLAKKRS